MKSLLNHINKNTDTIKNKKEIFQIVKKEIQIEIIALKKNDSNEKKHLSKKMEKFLTQLSLFLLIIT